MRNGKVLEINIFIYVAKKKLNAKDISKKIYLFSIMDFKMHMKLNGYKFSILRHILLYKMAGNVKQIARI